MKNTPMNLADDFLFSKVFGDKILFFNPSMSKVYSCIDSNLIYVTRNTAMRINTFSNNIIILNLWCFGFLIIFSIIIVFCEHFFEYKERSKSFMFLLWKSDIERGWYFKRVDFLSFSLRVRIPIYRIYRQLYKIV